MRIPSTETSIEATHGAEMEDGDREAGKMIIEADEWIGARGNKE